jgi:hypothetical protein
MALGFTFMLELEDGTPADSPILDTAASVWSPRATIPLAE